MSHQEKQRIFDEYAKEQGFEDWEDLRNFLFENDLDIDIHFFNLCDLVKDDRENRIADILQDAINLIDELPYDEKLQETRGNLCMNVQSLIFEVKKNAPELLDPKQNNINVNS